jgi:hypothetical protein
VIEFGVVTKMTQELRYSTALTMRGPWLLETSHLLALDDILARSKDESKASLTVLLSRERELKTSSFKEAMSLIDAQNEIATGFEFVAKAQDTTASVSLTLKHKGEKEQEEYSFEIKVSPPSEATSYRVFLDLKDWTETVEAPVWQQWLLFEPRVLYRIGLGFILLIVLATTLNTTPTKAEYKEALKQDARSLLHDGVNQQNQTRALELLLALESDYIPPGTKPQRARAPIGWYLVAVYVLGFLSFTPTLCIGIWAGRRRLRWWKLWMKLNTVTIPSLILARWVYPQLLSAFEAVLRH